ncbi:hypothetical protein GGR52DRAFT_577120 [Hypoxylon sp. FL1284]|nr:hypothetical protein GGR52DRAFT_577120 [Hypoxylon sp. FL1284]
MPSDAVLSNSAETIGLLETHENDNLVLDGKGPTVRASQRTLFARYGLGFAVASILLLSLVANVIQLWVWLRLAKRGRSSIAGVSLGGSIQFGDMTAWGDTSNMTAVDELWYGMDVNPGVIQLPKDAHLGTTQEYPWDTSKGLYILGAYHGLHCLQVTYTYVRESQEKPPQEQTITADHVIHCLDTMRADVMCQADDTILALEVPERAEKPPRRVCRNWSQLEEFAVRHSACFRRRAPGDPFFSSILEFMNCPPSSPYYAKVEELKAAASSVGGTDG